MVAGYRTYKADSQGIGSLLLGLHDESGELMFVGVVGAFTAARRRVLFEELQILVTSSRDTLPGTRGEGQASARTPQSSVASRWSAGKDMAFMPLKPERVVEVRYDHMEGDRFRHTTQFVRWRPDRDALRTFEQLETVGYDLSAILGEAERDG